MAVLHKAERDSLPDDEFAGKGRSYPIQDVEHGPKALQLDHNAPPAERASIERKVHEKYPSIDSGKDPKDPRGDPREQDPQHAEASRRVSRMNPVHVHKLVQDAKGGKYGQQAQQDAQNADPDGDNGPNDADDDGQQGDGQQDQQMQSARPQMGAREIFSNPSQTAYDQQSDQQEDDARSIFGGRR